MQITLLGTGVPTPNPKRRGPAQLIKTGNVNVLVDCGSGTVNQLVQGNVSPPQINNVLITHHHSDHYIDLDHFIITRWIMGADKPLHIYGPIRQKKIIENMLAVHEYDLKIRVEHQGTKRPLPEVIVHEIGEEIEMEIDGLKTRAFHVEHPPVDPAFGYRFDTQDRSIVISGDTRPCENIIKNAYNVDLLVHECMHSAKVPFVPGGGWKSAEHRIEAMARYHTFPEKLGLIAKDANPKILATTHMVSHSEPSELTEIIGHDYSGALVIGEDLMTI